MYINPDLSIYTIQYQETCTLLDIEILPFTVDNVSTLHNKLVGYVNWRQQKSLI